MKNSLTDLKDSQNNPDNIITIDEIQYAKFFLGIAEKLNGTKMNIWEFIKSEKAEGSEEFQREVRRYKNQYHR